MIVVMQEGATEPQIQAVIDRMVELGFTVHRSSGVLHTVLGGVGPVGGFDLANFEVMEGVQECHRIVSPYKLASRQFRPGGTVVKVGDVEIGGKAVVVMAGPCSIESREQIEAVGGNRGRGGATVIRGGAFKPRSSPYSFQGLGEEGLQDDARRGRPARAAGGQRGDGPHSDSADDALRGHPPGGRAQHAELQPAARAGQDRASRCC